MSWADGLKDKHRQKQRGEISLVCAQHEMRREKPADTVSIVLSQRVLYAANFLNVLQLMTYHWLHQLHICMKHSHSPTKQTTHTKNITHYLSARFPFTCFKCTSASERAWTDGLMTNTVLHNCFCLVLSLRYRHGC